MTHLVIFAKAPVAGFAKTRLIPALGADGAAALAHRLLMHTFEQALAANVQTVELCMSPAPADPAWQSLQLPNGVLCSDQGDGDLGARMHRAVARVLAEKSGPVLVIGTDCPELSAAHITEASRQLNTHDAALIPAADGGYVLIGLKTPCPVLFTLMPWSTSGVAEETRHRMASLGWRVWLGPVLHYIDEPVDLQKRPEILKNDVFKGSNRLVGREIDAEGTSE